MLQNVRDNLKGTAAVIVIGLLVVPLVVTGIGGSSFLGSVAGTNAAKVNKKSITRAQLDRAIYFQREQMISRGADATAEELSDDNLREPVLQSLVRRAALTTTAEKGGMGVADTELNALIVGMPAFQVDGKFDQQVYQRQIAQAGYTNTGFKEIISEDLLLQQNQSGVKGTTFISNFEMDAVIALTEERRSFSILTIPAAGREEAIEVSAEEVEAYYAENEAEFREPEQVSASYLELSVEALMNDIQVAEDDIKQRYEEEKVAFNENLPDPEVQIAHLMLEKQDNGSEGALIEELQARLADGEAFADLAKEYSADEGSRAAGGDLGVLIPGVFSAEFEAAANALGEGQISQPVETDAGIHLIKVISRKVESYPSIEEKTASLETALKREQAEEVYANSVQSLEDLTFSADNLQLAAKELNLEIKESPLFQRGSGSGIARNAAVRNGAFTEDVLLDGRNSPKIDIAAGHSVVLRLNEHSPEHIKPLELVKADIENALKKEKLAAQMEVEAEALIAELQAGADVKAISEERGYTLNEQDKVKRFEAPVDYAARMAVFALPVTGQTSYDSLKKANGDYAVLVLTEVAKGTREDVPEAQLVALEQQLKQENSNAEWAAYEESVVALSKKKLY